MCIAASYLDFLCFAVLLVIFAVIKGYENNYWKFAPMYTKIAKFYDFNLHNFETWEKITLTSSF